MIYLVENKNYLKNYESVSEEVKHITNSLSRLKILAALHEGPKNMKDLTVDTGLSYSSISSNMHELELKDYVYRESNRYFLSNSMKLQIEGILEFEMIVEILNQFFNILDKHLVEMIPNQSIAELYLLGKANLMESDAVDVYRMYNFMETALNSAEEVKCILPFYYENFNDILNGLVENNKKVEVMIPENIFNIFQKKSKVNEVSSFDGENVFLLIVTEELMILGLFKDDGFFDQNRLLTSKNSDSIRWANNLYENFKIENK